MFYIYGCWRTLVSFGRVRPTCYNLAYVYCVVFKLLYFVKFLHYQAASCIFGVWIVGTIVRAFDKFKRKKTIKEKNKHKKTKENKKTKTKTRKQTKFSKQNL